MQLTIIGALLFIFIKSSSLFDYLVKIGSEIESGAVKIIDSCNGLRANGDFRIITTLLPI